MVLSNGIEFGSHRTNDHLFAGLEDLRLEESRVHVELQHNGYDCGLYMLQYIEKIAKSMPDLVCKKRRAEGVQLRWEDLGPECSSRHRV